MSEKRPVTCVFGKNFQINMERFSTVTIYQYDNDQDIINIIIHRKPNVLVSIGPQWQEFPNLLDLSYQYRRKWIHLPNIEQLTENQLYNCFFHNINNPINPDQPLVSVFSTTYKSGHKIFRPFYSLQAQTYKNWEWVIIDDSPEEDNDETWKLLKELKKREYRIRIFRPDKNIALIGEVKKNAAGLCRGSFIAELDHDDTLLPNCLADIVGAFKQHPDAGFAHSDFSEIYENSNNFMYGQFWAFGHGCYYKQLYMNRWVNVARTIDINPKTIRNIVGAPNHIRVWRRDFYEEVHGHAEELPVADDFHLVVRSFLKTKIIAIPNFSYIQYRNEGGNNFTFIRNAEITKLQGKVRQYYEEDIHKRFVELGLKDPLYNVPWPSSKQAWMIDALEHNEKANVIYQDKPNRISIVMPTYNRPNLLRRAVQSILDQTYQDWELLIIGDNCPKLEETMEDSLMKDSRILWWNLDVNHGSGGGIPRNYALRMLIRGDYIAYLDDDNIWLPNHLETLWNALQSDKEIKYAFSSFIMRKNFPEQFENSALESTIKMEVLKSPQGNEIPKNAELVKIKVEEVTLEEGAKIEEMTEEEVRLIMEKNTKLLENISVSNSITNDTIPILNDSDEKIIICREPVKFRIDTSAILHRKELLLKYGYWHTQEETSYAHDWEFVSRWTKEKNIPTLQPTLLYNCDTSGQSPKWIYDVLQDQ